MFTQPPARPKATRGAMAFIFGVVLLDIIGLTMLVPVSPYIVVFTCSVQVKSYTLIRRTK